MNSDALVTAKIAELRVLEAQAKAIDKQIEAIKDSLKAELDSRKVDCLVIGPDKIFWQVIERRLVDSDHLKKAGLYDKFSKLTTVTQFKVTTSLTR